MFVDTSVIVAILAKEPDAAEFADTIEAAACRTSALVILEAAMRLSTKLAIDPVAVGPRIHVLLNETSITLAPMDARTASVAVKALADDGRGRGHPAQLTLADCLSHACAKVRGIPLLDKGMHFLRTDSG